VGAWKHLAVPAAAAAAVAAVAVVVVVVVVAAAVVVVVVVAVAVVVVAAVPALVSREMRMEQIRGTKVSVYALTSECAAE
jgi:hypothetical protein